MLCVLKTLMYLSRKDESLHRRHSILQIVQAADSTSPTWTAHPLSPNPGHLAVIKLVPQPSGSPGSPAPEGPGWGLDGCWLQRRSWPGPLGPLSEGPCCHQVASCDIGSGFPDMGHVHIEGRGIPRAFLLYLSNTNVNTQGNAQILRV